MERPVRLLPLALVLALAGPALLAPSGMAGSSDACPALERLEGVGLVCPRADGLYEVFSPDGAASLGFVHGADPVPGPADPLEPQAAGSAPHCVSGAPGQYHVTVIYARASDDADRYGVMAPTVRDLVHRANKMVADAGLATGGAVGLRVRCLDGVVAVDNVVLPTPMAEASFSTIVSDLRAMGYDDRRVKHWVFYDDTGACACGGVGHLYSDDRLILENYNNGASGAQPMFAVDFGYDSTNVWLHELGHNMGAVQDSAPHTTGGGHCTDGRDTMCYNDGGPNGAKYTTSACGTEVWDCGKDDYFHVSPLAGSYLASHWNIGSSLNRFVEFLDNAAPSAPTLSCAPQPAETLQEVTCTFSSLDDSTGLQYRVDWGDGSVSLVPESGHLAPGTAASARHAYETVGNRTVRVSATDNETEPLTGPEATFALRVEEDVTAPSLAVSAPAPRTAYHGCSLQAPTPYVRPVFVERGCVVASATDARSGVAKVVVLKGGVILAEDAVAPYVLDFRVPASAYNAALVVRAVDAAGNAREVTVAVDMWRTLPS